MSPAELLRNIDASWRAAGDLSVEQIYLKANPLREVALECQHIVPRLLGPRGTTPGPNFIFVHLNRSIKSTYVNMIYIFGHGQEGAGRRADQIAVLTARVFWGAIERRGEAAVQAS